jgi:hypothetical protein
MKTTTALPRPASVCGERAGERGERRSTSVSVRSPIGRRTADRTVLDSTRTSPLSPAYRGEGAERATPRSERTETHPNAPKCTPTHLNAPLYSRRAKNGRRRPLRKHPNAPGRTRKHPVFRDPPKRTHRRRNVPSSARFRGENGGKCSRMCRNVPECSIKKIAGAERTHARGPPPGVASTVGFRNPVRISRASKRKEALPLRAAPPVFVTLWWRLGLTSSSPSSPRHCSWRCRPA